MSIQAQFVRLQDCFDYDDAIIGTDMSYPKPKYRRTNVDAAGDILISEASPLIDPRRGAAVPHPLFRATHLIAPSLFTFP